MSDETVRKTTAHIIQSGDCVESLAFRHGLAPETLWQHADNQALRDEGFDPHVLPVGHIIHIPERLERRVDAAVDQVHRFRRRGVPAKFELRLMDEDAPRAGLNCELTVDGRSQRVVTDGEGRLDVWISPLAKRATLHINDYEEYDLKLAHLQPPELDDDLGGVRSRLDHLGYQPHPEHLDEALARFQSDQGLPETGEPDAQTLDALIHNHGS